MSLYGWYGCSSDLGLPDGNGCEIMRRAKDRKAIKAIAVSSYGMEEEIARSRLRGHGNGYRYLR